MTIWKCVLLAAAGLVAGCQTLSRPVLPTDLAINNVTVIDPESRRVLPARSVHVSDGQIVAVVPAGLRNGYAAGRTVDGTGRYLIPGLIDAHVHLFLPEPAPASLNLLLANGVTGIREMSSDCWAAAGAKKGCIADYLDIQRKVRNGELPGPDLLGLTSTMVMGPTRLKLSHTAPAFITPVNEGQARELVSYLATRGVDLIKTHDSIPTAAFLPLLDEAKKRGLAVAGHVPFAAGSLGAATRGFRSIEHARDLLYDCSRYGPEFRRQEAAFAEGVAGAARPSNLERLDRTVAEFDAEQCTGFLARLAATGVYYVPTHVTREMEARANEGEYRSDAARKYVLATRNKRWEADLDETAGLPAAERNALRRFFEHGLRTTGLAHRAGIPIMAGTDSSDTMIVPGFSLHRELQLLQRAGLSPMEVLRAATTTPARYFNRTADLGGIAPGKRADLVLLRADPLSDIRNSASIEMVVANGRLFDRAALGALLANAEQWARAN